jgi:hypothetical protein
MNDVQADVPPLSPEEVPAENLVDAEKDIDALNRQITAAVVGELQAGGFSPELAAIIEARDALIARLSRLEGESHGRRQEQDRQAGSRPDQRQ